MIRYFYVCFIAVIFIFMPQFHIGLKCMYFCNLNCKVHFRTSNHQILQIKMRGKNGGAFHLGILYVSRVLHHCFTGVPLQLSEKGMKLHLAGKNPVHRDKEICFSWAELEADWVWKLALTHLH